MDAACNIEVVDRYDAVVLIVEGELDLTTSHLLEERLAAAEDTDAPLVIVDLDRVSFMDSSGLRVLVARAAPNGDRVRLTRGSRQVRRLFEVAGMSERFSFVSSDPRLASPPYG
jgi:anti-sigma B factor antagonist